MAGVEILNQIPVTEAEMTIGLGWLMVIAIAILVFIAGIFAVFDSDDLDLGLVLGAVVAVGVTLVIMVFSAKQVPTGEYQYEVVVEEEVNLHEFYDYYNVIEQRGEIFIVQEKSSE